MFSCMCFFFFLESLRSRYKVQKIIGEGGYGKVYEGIRISDGKKVDRHFALTLKSEKKVLFLNTQFFMVRLR